MEPEITTTDDDSTEYTDTRVICLDPPSTIRMLAQSYEDTQRNRIAIGNRILAYERCLQYGSGASVKEIKDAKVTTAMIRKISKKSPVRSLADLHADYLTQEAKIQRNMTLALRTDPVWNAWLSYVKGAGPVLACKIGSHIRVSPSVRTLLDPTTGEITEVPAPYADTPSALIRHAGYGVVDGKRERSAKGVRNSFNKHLKTAVYLLGNSFIKCQSPYTKVYYQAKERYQEQNATRPKAEQRTKGHIHAMARAKMVKLFLAHLWVICREVEGLPTRSPYVEEYLGHTHIISPWDMVEIPQEQAA